MKLHKLIVIVLILIASLSILAVEAEQDVTEKKPTQTLCPVMGGKINKNLHADHEGQRVYFCCSGCEKPFKNNPEKFLKKIEENGEQVEKLQTKCPVMGGKINKSMYADVKGKRIYVCCPGCINTIESDPDKYIKILEDQGITIDKVDEQPQDEE